MRRARVVRRLGRCPAPEPHRRHPILTTLDAFLFGFAAVSAVWLAYLLLRESFHANWQLLLVVGSGCWWPTSCCPGCTGS